jgi:hypothetical protein
MKLEFVLLNFMKISLSLEMTLTFEIYDALKFLKYLHNSIKSFKLYCLKIFEYLCVLIALELLKDERFHA